MRTGYPEAGCRSRARWRQPASGCIAVFLLAIAAAGCGGSSGGPASDATTATAASGQHATSGGGSAAALAAMPAIVRIAVKHVPRAGAVLAAGPSRRTVYAYERDRFGPSRSSCIGPCTSTWPPVLSKGPAIVAGRAKASLLGSIRRPDGTTQVTYSGHPLYYFSGDRRVRDIRGEGTEGLWYVLAPEGVEILVR